MRLAHTQKEKEPVGQTILVVQLSDLRIQNYIYLVSILLPVVEEREKLLLSAERRLRQELLF